MSERRDQAQGQLHERRSHLGDRLAAYVDGELPRGTRELVAAHLALCAACRAAAALEARTKQGLADLGGPDPSAGLMSSLLDLAGPGEPMPPRRRPLGAAPRPAAVPVGPGAPRARRPLFAAGVVGVAAMTLTSAYLGASRAEPGPAIAPAGGTFTAQPVRAGNATVPDAAAMFGLDFSGLHVPSNALARGAAAR